LRGRDRRADGRAYLLGMNSYPEMLMKNKVLSDAAGRFRMTRVESQVIEMQALSRIEVRPGKHDKKMLKMKVDPDELLKTKGKRK